MPATCLCQRLSRRLTSRGPDAAVVSEVDDPRVELLERVDPGGDIGQGLAVAVPVGVPGQLVGGVLGGGVVTLPSNDDNPIGPVDHKRLVTGGVTWGGHERDPGQHLGLAGHLLEPAAVNEFWEGVVRCFPGAGEFGCLDEDRELAQFRVPAAVVEVQMGIGGEPQVSDRRSGGCQGFGQVHPAGPVVGVNLRMGAHSGVEQKPSCRVVDDIAQAGLHPGGTGTGLLRGPHEVPQIDTPDSDAGHGAIVSGRRLAQPPQASDPPGRQHRLLADQGDRGAAGEPGAVVVPASTSLVTAPPVHPVLGEAGLGGPVVGRRVISGTVSGVIPGSAGGG
jgi:hypothetical protein